MKEDPEIKNSTYPPISDYGYIGDCHSSALISKSCSIDWCCMPRVDSPSCFGRLLDWKTGGYCKIAPEDPSEVSRRYAEESLILETTFRTSDGEAPATQPAVSSSRPPAAGYRLRSRSMPRQ